MSDSCVGHCYVANKKIDWGGTGCVERGQIIEKDDVFLIIDANVISDSEIKAPLVCLDKNGNRFSAWFGIFQHIKKLW